MSRVSWLNDLNLSVRPIRPRRSRRATNVATVLSRIEALEDRTLLATFTVDNTDDSGAGSLRQAILDANAAAGADTIAFNLPADDPGHVYYQDDGIAGQVTLANVAATTEADDANIADIDPDWAFSWWTIAPLSQLPALTDAVLIDGYTQPGSHQNINAVGQGLDTILRVEIDGTQSAVENEVITTGLLTLSGGDSTVRGLAINRQFGPGILIGSTGNSVEGNFIGPDISGTAEFDTSAQPTVDARFGFNGVTVSGGLVNANNVIGGTTAAARNLISAITGGPPSSSDNFGVKFSSDNNRVAGNLIGTDRTGTVALPNGTGGVSAGSRNTIGGQDAAAGNVISGNPLGIVLANTNIVLNNLVGTDPSGTLNVGNTAVGILSGFNARDNQIRGNTVAFNGAAPPSGGITGTTSAAGIRVVFGTVGSGNLISRNSIFGNFGPGIDLGTDGFTPNDVPPASDPPDQDTGANDLQNTPILTSVTDTGGGTDIVGMLQSTPNSNFRIEFFTNSDRNFDADPSGTFTGGEAFFASVDVITGATGVANFAFPLPSLPGGMPYVSATATNITDDGSGPLNNTSEFSPVAVVGGPSFVVTNTSNTGPGSLREAIVNANLVAGTQTISFNIPADDPLHFFYADDGVAGQVTFENTTVTSEADDANIAGIDPDWTSSWFGIILDTALPEITETVTIDGYTQPGASENTLTFDQGQGLDTVLKIELDGRNVAGNGFSLGFDSQAVNAGGSVIRGFAINRFGGDGVELNTLDGGNTVAGVYIGTDVSGTLPLGNGGNGVLVSREPNSTIGGESAGDRGVISANGGDGIRRIASSGFSAIGLRIGLSATSSTVLANGGNGIAVVFGGAGLSPVSANPLSNVQAASSLLFGSEAFALEFGNLLLGIESVEVTSDDSESPDPGDDGVVVSQTTTTAAPPPAGASLAAAPTEILQIDLGGDGVTPNDPQDLDEGPNGLQNYPVLTSAVTDAGTTTVNGTLNSTPNSTFRIEFFSQSFGSNFRVGQRFLGDIDVTTDANGDAAFVFDSPIQVPVGEFLTATATLLLDLDNNPVTPLNPVQTSEFSAALNVTNGQPPVPVRADLLALRPSDVRFEAQASDGTQFTRDPDYGLLAGTAALSDYRVGDFNGDGLDDVVARRDATGQVIVALSDGTQMTSSVWTLWSPNATWDQVVVGDFDRDGRDDVAGLASSGTFLVSLSNGTGFDNVSFGAVSGTVNWVDLFSGDVNNDGFDDVILRSSTGAWVVGLSDGIHFSFSLFGRWSAAVNWQDVTTGDFNGDGRLDVVGRSPSGKVVVGLSDGTGFSFSVFATWSTAVSWETQIGDFDNDGRDDIFSRASSGTIVMNLSTGTSFARSAWGALSTNVDWLFFVGDFDADGDDDIAGIASTGTMVTGLSTGSGFNTSVWGAWPDRDTRNPYFVGNFVTG